MTTRRAPAIVAGVIVALLLLAVVVAQRGPGGVVVDDPVSAGDIVAAPSPSEADPTTAAEPTPGPTGPAPAPEPSPDASATDSPASDAPSQTAEPSPAPEPSELSPSEAEPIEDDAGAALWGRRFRSTSVTEDGRPRVLVPGTHLSVSFGRDVDDAPWIGWSGGCNGYGAPVEVSETHVRLLEGPMGTLVGCAEPVEQQDAFLTRFLESTPTWELAGERLTLRSGDTVIVFEESAETP